MKIQAISWQAQASKQQDSFLISNGDICRIIQNKAIISKTYDFNTNFIIAVADGIASSPYSGLISKKLLTLLAEQFNKNIISFQTLQDELNHYFSQGKYQGAGSTLAMAYYHAHENIFELRHLGDSRIYHFNHMKKQWCKLTHDHTYLNELTQEIQLDKNQQYASSYDILYHYFCIDDNQFSCFPSQNIQLNTGDYLLICTDGVHDVLDSEHWLLPYEMSTKQWLSSMYKLLQQHKAWDNMTMILMQY